MLEQKVYLKDLKSISIPNFGGFYEHINGKTNHHKEIIQSYKRALKTKGTVSWFRIEPNN
jgi:hypothetical protein